MTDLCEYETIISGESLLQIKGHSDDEVFLWWLEIKVSPDYRFFAEVEFFNTTNDILTFLDELSTIHKNTRGKSTLKTNDFGSYITFDLSDSRDLFISGQFNKRWDDGNQLKFRFKSDQSIIPHLIDVLRELITLPRTP